MRIRHHNPSTKNMNSQIKIEKKSRFWGKFKYQYQWRKVNKNQWKSTKSYIFKIEFPKSARGIVNNTQKKTCNLQVNTCKTFTSFFFRFLQVNTCKTKRFTSSRNQKQKSEFFVAMPARGQNAGDPEARESHYATGSH